MEESNQRKSGAILSYVAIIINTLVQLIYTPFLIRMLGQSEYGLYSLVSSIIGYLTVLDLGFGNAIIVYTAKYRAQKKYEEERKLHGMVFIIFCIIGVIAALLGLVLYFNVNNIFGATMTSAELSKTKIMMLILAFNLAITFPFSIYSSIITAYEKFTFQKILSIVNTLMKPLLMMPLLFLGYKSISMTAVITIINIVVLLSNYLYCKNKLNIKIKFQVFDKTLFKTIFGYSFFIFLGTIVDKVNWSVDQFVLGAVSGTIAVSLYSVAAQINTLFMNISSCCCSVMLPKLSKMVSNKATEKEFNNEFIKFGRIQWYIIFLLMSGLVIFGKRFISMWVGVGFEKSYYVMLLLVVPLGFVLIENIGVYIMQAKNLHKAKAIVTIICAIFNVIISIPLASKYGAIGSALGTSITLIICNIIILNIYYYKVVKLNVIKFWDNIIKITIPLLIVACLFYFISNFYFYNSGLFIYGFCIILYTLIYSILSYTLCFNSYEKNILRNILKKIKKRLR